MFGINGGEFIVILLVIVIVVGPQRLPEYTAKLTQMVKQLRLFVENAKEQIAEEVGPEFADLNLKDLDPRNYDPRKIVRDALGEDLDAIKRDLSHPFESVVKAGKEASESATVDTRSTAPSKSLSQMIEDKAQEKRAASTQQASSEPAAESTASPSVSQESQDHEEKLAVIEEAEEKSEVSQEAQEKAEQTGGAELTEEKPESDQDAEEEAEGAEDAVAASTPKAEEDVRTGDEAVDEGEATLEEEEAHSEDEAVDEGEATVDEGASQAAATIPSSLTDAAQPAGQNRPISPRDIIRAANEAARTRAEARRVTVDA